MRFDQSRQYFSSILKDDVRFLTTLLGDVVREQEGQGFFNKIEQIRKLAIEIREDLNPQSIREQRKIIHSLSLEEAYKIARTFSIYFQLVNIAEERQRIRRIQAYTKDETSLLDMSLRKVFHDLHDRKILANKVWEFMSQMDIELVLTAHPTQAKRRSVLDHLLHIASDLTELGKDDLSGLERGKYTNRIKATLEILWQTSEIRQRRVEVVDEIDQALFYFQRTILNLVQDFYEKFWGEFQRFYGKKSLPFRPFLYFGSWVGADRDGNPNVTCEITKLAAKNQKQLILKSYLNSLQRLIPIFSQSFSLTKVSKEFLDSVKRDASLMPRLAKTVQRYELSEIYRKKVSFMYERIENTLKGAEPGYASEKEFLNDILLIQESLRKNNGGLASRSYLECLIWQVNTFGFYLAKMDFRDNSKKIRLAMTAIFPDYNPSEEFILKQILTNRNVKQRKKLSVVANDVVKQLKTMRQIQDEVNNKMVEDYIISMTENSSDVLSLFYLAKREGLIQIKDKKIVKANIGIVPLFEVIDALDNCHIIMDQLFSIPIYRSYVRARGNLQQVMLGYSDSSKDGGYLAANWKIYMAQKKLLEVAKKHGIRLQIFHGKGGTIDRGGGQSHKAILAQPEAAPEGQIKITEQGEVVAQKYSQTLIAERNLEQLVSAVMWTNLIGKKEIQENDKISEWEKRMETLSDYSLDFYRKLLIGSDGFLEFYNQATPVQILEFARIGSRPVHRGGKREFKDLRAIPWVFSWIQSRYIISSWYGIGYAIDRYIEEKGDQGLNELRIMYKGWSYFQSIIDNAQISLEKTDLHIAEQYGALVSDKEMGAGIHNQILSEYKSTMVRVKEVSGQKNLLDSQPILKQSIRLRNPYIDPLHYIQIRFLDEIRRKEFAGQSDSQKTMIYETLLLTMNGISAGMKSTG